MEETFRVVQALRYTSCKPFFESLNNLPYVVIKGEPLSVYAYGKTGQRISSDIDILISRDDIQILEQQLTSFGFQNSNLSRQDRIFMLSSSHQVAPWVKSLPVIGCVNIDVNFDLFWGEHPTKSISIKEFISDAITMDIYGVQIKTLSPLKSMIQLVLHHYKEMNSLYLLATRNCIRRDMFQDVYRLWKNNLDLMPADKLYSISAEYKIIPYIFYILYYTSLIFPDLKLQQYIEPFRTNEGEELLSCYGLCANERKRWKYDFESRFHAANLYPFIKDDLTSKDKEKIEINKQIFG